MESIRHRFRIIRTRKTKNYSATISIKFVQEAHAPKEQDSFRCRLSSNEHLSNDAFTQEDALACERVSRSVYFIQAISVGGVIIGLSKSAIGRLNGGGSDFLATMRINRAVGVHSSRA